ncbi:MAG: cytochrome c1 [Legionellales bacterium]|nr:cytochrome c1 [Legionellales bacterium]
MTLFKFLTRIILFIFLISSLEVFATSNSKLMHMEVDLSNQQSLQRGAKIFVNYCLSCHSATYMRYNRIGEDLNIKDDILKENLIFSGDKIGDVMSIAMKSEDAINFFGVTPPDLSVIARSRGPDWLYTYLHTFYVDDSRPFGVNNLAYKDTAMPHVLWELQGAQQLIQSGKNVTVHYKPTYKNSLELVSSGLQSEKEYDKTIRDLVNYLVYMGEPIKLKRKKIGIWVIFYLSILLIITYMLKKEYWRDIH